MTGCWKYYMFDTTCRDGICRLARPETRWLTTGWDGGYVTADDAINISVPSGFDRTDLATYVTNRRERADMPGNGPALLTGVDLVHARGARAGSVTTLATVGLSNPAALPLDPSGETDVRDPPDGHDPSRAGTVNLLIGTRRALDDGTLASLLATAVEAKAVTLSGLTGFSGTTTDAIAVGCNPTGETAPFAGSGTDLGADTRACVREAIRASFESKYTPTDRPDTVADAANGAVTTRRADTFRP